MKNIVWVLITLCVFLAAGVLAAQEIIKEEEEIPGGIPAEAEKDPGVSAPPPAAGAPKNLRAEEQGMEIYLKWDTIDIRGAGYNIYRSLSESGGYVKINKQTEYGYTYLDNKKNSVSPPVHKTVYYYRVAGVVEGLETGESNVVSARAFGPLAPPSAESVKMAVTLQSIGLKWMQPESTGENAVSGYNIFRAVSAPDEREKLNPSIIKDMEFTDAGGNTKITEGVKYYYWLQSVDSAGNTSPLSAPLTAVPFNSGSAPRNVTTVPVSSESIKVVWEEPETKGTYGISGYNIYRSTQANFFPDSPVNEKIVFPYMEEGGKLFYFDNIVNSETSPETGVNYYYKVETIDTRGNTGATSSAATGLIPFLEVKKSGILSADISEYGLPPGSNLALSGMKSIDLEFKNTWYPNKDVSTTGEVNSSVFSFTMNQVLTLLLKGNIGKNIFVDIDYSEKDATTTTFEEDGTKISIKYQGEKGETVQEVSFGDITLTLPSTKYVSFTETLFGIKGLFSFFEDKLTLTTVLAQSKGISAVQTFTGSLRKKEENGVIGVKLSDTGFIKNQYFYLTKDPDQVNYYDTTGALPERYIEPGSVTVYIDDNNVYTDNPATVFSSPSGQFHFDGLSLGRDYTVDYKTGVIKLNVSITTNHIIAVAYRVTDGTGTVESVGYTSGGAFDFDESGLVSNSSGYTSDAAHLIQSDVNDLSHRVVSYYYMGETQIFNPENDTEYFDITLHNAAGTSVGSLPKPWFDNSDDYYEIDTENGVIKFRAFYPFAITADTSNPANPNDSGTLNSTGLEEDAYNITNPQTLYYVYMKYKYYMSSYKLDNINVVVDSERIYMDNQLLKKDTDYYIFYQAGEITFSEEIQNRITDETEIQIYYEYTPFFQAFQNNVAGGRLDYKLFENLNLGATFLYKGSNAGTDVPSARSTETSLATPFSMWIFDVNANFDLTKENVNNIISSLPFLDKTDVPVDFKFTGEYAYSDFSINIYDWNNERGVAMIDDMEGADNIVSASMSRNAWFPASAPYEVDTDNRVFISRINDTRISPQTSESSSTSLFDFNETTVLRLDYSGRNLTSSKWDSIRYVVSSQAGQDLNLYNFLEMWIYVDTDNPVDLTVDVGVISEDSNGNGLFEFNEGDGDGDSEDKNMDGRRDTGEDTGISPGIYPFTQPADEEDALYTYWGRSNSVLDTEDMNANGKLDSSEAYYRFSTARHLSLRLQGAGEWKNIRIPLKEFYEAPGVSPVDAIVTSKTYMNKVKHVRLTLKGSAGVPSNGSIEIESIKFTGNSWRLEVLDNSTDLAGNNIDAPDINKFNVGTISRNSDEAEEYEPITTFYEITRQEDKYNEKALDITYNLSSFDSRSSDGLPIYYVTKDLNSSTGYDYQPYETLKFDVYYKKRDELAGPGRVMFLRLGSGTDDETNYYQYNVLLDGLTEGEWQTVEFNIDGSDKKRSEPVGVPNLRSIQYITIGFINPNSVPADERIFVNNIRLTDPDNKRGAAKYASGTMNIENVASITGTIEDKDADFKTVAEINQSQLKQHLRTSAATFNTKQMAFIPPTTNTLSRTEYYTEDGYREDPSYTSNFSIPDTISDNYTNYVGFTPFNGFNVYSNFSMVKTQNNFLPLYRYRTNTTDRTTWSPSAKWNLPKNIWFIPLGTNDVEAKYTFTNTKIDYNEQYLLEATSTTVTAYYYDSNNDRRDQIYTWNATYNLWKFALMPNCQVQITEEMGNLASKFKFYESIIGDLNYIGRYLMTLRKITPKLTLSAPDLWIFSPRIEYTTSNSMDFTLNKLITTGKLAFSTALSLNKIVSWLPNITAYSITINLNESYDNTANPGIFNQWEDMLFERKWNLFLYKMLYEENEIKILEAMSSFGTMTITHSLNLSDFKFFDKVSFTPQFTYDTARNSSNRVATTGTETMRFNLYNFRIYRVTLPLLDFAVKDQDITGSYSYTRSKTKQLSTNSLTREDFTHSGNINMQYIVKDGPNGSIGVSGSFTETEDYTTGITTDTFRITPSFILHYSLKIDNPIEIPGWFPFGLGGKKIKLEQNIDLTSTTSVEISKIDRSDDTSESDSFKISTGVNGSYNLLKNLKINVGLEYAFYNDVKNDTNTYHQINFKVGGVLEF